MTKLFAISDLHLNHAANWEGLQALLPHPNDWLIVAGDVSHTEARFAQALSILSQRFAQVFWTPGNHDLWTLPRSTDTLRGVFKYNRLVSICRDFGVLTPEDPYTRWPGKGPARFVAPIFTLYDYSYRPEHVPLATAVQWAAQTEVVCADEYVLHPDPFTSRIDWCTARVRYTERRLAQTAKQGQLILVSHFPLRQDTAATPRIPRFSIWCGTKHTENWHTRFPVTAVVYGHLHIRISRTRDGVPFEEVSLGYPQQWRSERGMHAYFRRIL